MIFPVLKTENIIQVNDMTRLDVGRSYITPDEQPITLIEIEPAGGVGFLDVTSKGYLDYQYSTGGDKTITVRVTTDGVPVTLTLDLPVVTKEEDKLFSTDEQLTGHESDILEYIKAGRNSFLNVHRVAQGRIVTWLDEHRITDTDGNRLTKEAIVDIEEVSDWSKYLTLRLIFEDLSNSNDDIFSGKSSHYKNLENVSKNRSQIRLDLDGDGKLETSAVDLRTFSMKRQ